MAITQLTGKNVQDYSLDISLETSGTLPVTRGGTGATTAAAARTNLGISSGSGDMLKSVYDINGDGILDTAISELKKLTAVSINASVSLTLPATSLGAGGTITVTTTDTASTLKTKISTLPGYNDSGVLVSGSVIGTVSSEIHTLTANAWSGVNLTSYNATSNPTGDIDGALHYRQTGQTKLASTLI